MLPAILAAARAYAPWLVLPFAAAIGAIGYTIEGAVSDKYTPWKKSAIGKKLTLTSTGGHKLII